MNNQDLTLNLNRQQSQSLLQNFFVFGKIGNNEIIRQDIPIFSDSLIQVAWTNILAYRPAQHVEVKLLFEANKSNYNLNVNSGPNMQEILVEENSRLDDFKHYSKDIESNKIKTADNCSKEKINYINNILKDMSMETSASTSELTRKTKDYLKNIYLSDSKLSSKLQKYSSYFNSLPTNNPSSSSSSGASTNIYGNNDFSLFNNNDNKTNDTGKMNNNLYTNNVYNPNSSNNTSSSASTGTSGSYGNNYGYGFNMNNSSENNNAGSSSSNAGVNMYGLQDNKVSPASQPSTNNNNWYANDNYGYGTSSNNKNNQSNQNNQNTDNNSYNPSNATYGYGYNMNANTNNNKKTYYD